MGTAVVEEYENLAFDANGQLMQVPGHPIAVQTVTTGATTARTATAFNDRTKFLIISSDTDEAFKLGDSTVNATTSDRALYASTYRPIAVDLDTVHPPTGDAISKPTHIAFINK